MFFFTFLSLVSSRRAALQHLIRDEGSSRELVDEMEEKVVHEGWKPDVNLPKGWLLRTLFSKWKNNMHCTKYNILSREGDVLASFKEATEYMSSMGCYTSEDLLKLQTLIAERTPALVGWTERSGLPSGWKAKAGKKKSFHLRAPSGKFFFGARKALQYMVSPA